MLTVHSPRLPQVASMLLWLAAPWPRNLTQLAPAPVSSAPCTSLGSPGPGGLASSAASSGSGETSPDHG